MSTNIETFIALLALDPEKRDKFLADPEAALEAAGVADSPQLQPLKGALKTICNALSQVAFPPPTTEPHGPPG